ncbi:MAG: DUF4245 domain-containing protein [Humibacillus sp.]|nr:DUF4245 domain-containing protein [Humibacillus sp.]MDN5777975.1 DUF4245 domain-containing protein [Humibacillus sp.]
MTPEPSAIPTPTPGPGLAPWGGSGPPELAKPAAVTTPGAERTDVPVRGDLPESLPGSSGRNGDEHGTVDDGSSAPAAPPRSRYSMGSMSNMLRSMFVIGLFVLALVAVIPRISAVDRPAIDAAGKASQTASLTTWPIEMPTGLGKGWVPTVATYAAGIDKVPTFTTVWTTPSGADIAFKQAAGATGPWLAQSVNNGTLAGSATVAGRTFERYDDAARQQLSYVLRGTGKTEPTLVATSTAPESELKTFVAALEQVTPGNG